MALISACCGAPPDKHYGDRCSECKEVSEFIDDAEDLFEDIDFTEDDIGYDEEDGDFDGEE